MNTLLNAVYFMVMIGNALGMLYFWHHGSAADPLEKIIDHFGLIICRNLFFMTLIIWLVFKCAESARDRSRARFDLQTRTERERADNRWLLHLTK